MNEGIERTATLNITWDCTLCGGDINIISGERQRHVCKLPAVDPRSGGRSE